MSKVGALAGREGRSLNLAIDVSHALSKQYIHLKVYR